MSETETRQVEIRRLDESDPAQLHCQYQGQHAPQPCYVELDIETGRLGADYRGSIGGGISMREFHGITRTWSIPALRAAAANELLTEITPFATRIVAGARVVWDGNNHVGRLNEDALAAEEEIARLCERVHERTDNVVQVWEAENWYQWESASDLTARLGITADTTDEEIETLAEQEANTALESPEVDVIRGVEKHLQGIRDNLVWEHEVEER